MHKCSKLWQYSFCSFNLVLRSCSFNNKEGPEPEWVGQAVFPLLNMLLFPLTYCRLGPQTWRRGGSPSRKSPERQIQVSSIVTVLTFICAKGHKGCSNLPTLCLGSMSDGVSPHQPSDHLKTNSPNRYIRLTQGPCNYSDFRIWGPWSYMKKIEVIYWTVIRNNLIFKIPDTCGWNYLGKSKRIQFNLHHKAVRRIVLILSNLIDK